MSPRGVAAQVIGTLGQHCRTPRQLTPSGCRAADARSVGLAHVAFKVGDTLEDLREFKQHLERHQVAVLGMADHKVSQSLYLADPDGIEIEVYVDADPSIWKENPATVATIGPLRL